MGVSFGLTQQLFNFWQRAGYEPLYVRQNASDTTGTAGVMLIACLLRTLLQSRMALAMRSAHDTEAIAVVPSYDVSRCAMLCCAQPSRICLLWPSLFSSTPH